MLIFCKAPAVLSCLSQESHKLVVYNLNFDGADYRPNVQMFVTQCGVNLWVQCTECGLQSVLETDICVTGVWEKE